MSQVPFVDEYYDLDLLYDWTLLSGVAPVGKTFAATDADLETVGRFLCGYKAACEPIRYCADVVAVRVVDLGD